jgi:hypothetical protein
MTEESARYDFEVRPVRWVIAPRGEPQFHERATIVEVQDEAAGEFVTVTQDDQTIKFDPEEWPFLREAIEAALKECLR